MTGPSRKRPAESEPSPHTITQLVLPLVRRGQTSRRNRRLSGARLLLVAAVLAASSSAQPVGAQAPPADFRYIEERCATQGGNCNVPGPTTPGSPAFCGPPFSGCGSNFRNCLRPTVVGPYIEPVIETTGDRTARYVFDVIAPWNNYASSEGQSCNVSGTQDVIWRTTPVPSDYCPAGQQTLLQPRSWDHYETWVQGSTLSCSISSSAIDGPWYVLIKTCQQPCCLQLCPPFCEVNCVCGFQTWEEKTVPMQEITPRDLGCERPPARPCEDMEGVCCLPGGAPPIGGTPGGALTRPTAEGGAGLPVALTGIFVVPEGGAPADFDLSYFAGAAGRPGLPGSVAWSTRLGQGWSHAFAQRIVVDPDEQHVWRIDGNAGYTEFDDLAAGVYTTVLPADEKRTLEWLGAGAGWLLGGLDGSETLLRADGQWLETVDRLGKTTSATYSGDTLVGVTMPDGRSYELTYHGSGKLESITEIGVDQTTTRSWQYAWAGHQLGGIAMPDGRAWEFEYSASLLPRMTRQRLVPAGGGTARVERAWEYDDEGVLLRTWKGAETFGAAEAVEPYEFAQPTEGETVVTDPYGNDTTYTWEREVDSGAPRVVSMVGDCPHCGASPVTTWQYTDPVNPLRPTVIEDALARITEIDYDAFGMVTNRREAVGTPETRETFWDYDEPAFPAFPTAITRPSAIAGCPGGRVLETMYDSGNGRPTSSIVSGCEQPGDASVTAFTTTFDYTGTTGPEAATIDPPGHGTADQTTSTYDPARGDLLVTTRTVPNPTLGNPTGTATTSFLYDAFNRRIEVVDPNGVHTYTCYDALDRVTRSVQSTTTLADPCAATTGAGVLVTAYEYDPGFKDLLRVVLPRGNAIEHGYEAATGRLLTITRKETATGPGEQRVLYTLDDYGHRTLVEHQELDGSWQTRSKTGYEYFSRCHLDRTLHDPDGAPAVVTEYGYDCVGNLEKVWDAEHPNPPPPDPPVDPSQLYTYDPLDRLITVTEQWGGAGGGTVETHYDYDVQDHLVQVIDAEGNPTDYVYNDRDLLVRETMDWLVDPLADCTTDPCAAGCGCTAHAYDEHAELVTSIDPRGVETSRTVDAADRVTHIDYGADPTLDVDYDYGETPALFDVGRLTGITRHGATVAYEYDAFGRMTRDGDLLIGYDDNGNRDQITYPGGVTATYTFDYADREESLEVDTGSGPALIAGGVLYEPSGPLSALTLGNGRTETRAFDNRYFPQAITVSGGLLDWSYTTDAMGNVTLIEDLTAVPEPDRLYMYQPFQYFLDSASGPWPGPLGWSYDAIGNRLSETRGGTTDAYAYTLNPGAGSTPLLESVTLGGGGGTWTYEYGDAGHLTGVTAGANEIALGVADDGRMTMANRTGGETALFTYDGRSFLAEATNDVPERGPVLEAGGIFADGFEAGDVCAWSSSVGWNGPRCPSGPETSLAVPHYTSDGALHFLDRGPAPSQVVLYLAGRPVALLALDVQPTWLYLTTDHVGTPVLATDAAGNTTWSGGLEPFGRDWRAGTSGGASENGVFLRFPGQWVDPSWEDATLGAGLYYNVHRWYEGGTGRYTRPDPLGLGGGWNLFLYAGASPTSYIDPLGLTSYEGFDPDDEAVLKQGVQEAKQRLGECCAGADSPRLLDLLEKAKFVADDTLLDRRFFSGCAEVTFWGYLTNTIKVDPEALRNPGWMEQCCVPGGLVVHEVTHLTLPGQITEGFSYDNEHSCFGCEQSVEMQEYLEEKRKRQRPPGSIFGGP